MKDVTRNPAKAFRLDFHHAGLDKSILIINATCSWCGYPDTQCVAILKRGEILNSAGGTRPAYTITAALCNACFKEYWEGGGNRVVVA